ncbi:MAG TPA: uroporphyrinogen-III C-methyltransferase [Azonexus sp.]|nr:uroporphyrinogen-III C-methyltransferase [Azonexus sp.]
MPDNDKSPVLTVTPYSPPSPPPGRFAWQKIGFFIALAALLLSGWQWLETRQRLAETQQEVARRLAEANVGNQEDRGAQKELRQQIEDLQAKLGTVEGKLTEFAGQSATLESLYQDIARSREAATLLEVEQAITLAVQQLQLAGNVPVAILALQTADARLARLDRPQYLPLRKALTKDLERLSALPFADVPGISLRLEQVLIGIDKLPLASGGRPPETAENSQADELLPWWQRSARQIWQELKGLVRIQRFDQAEPVLLAPGQEFFLRENLKLRLLNARLALLSRDQVTYRNEIKVAQEWLARYFQNDDKAVQSALATLKPMAAAPLSLELPNLNDSQAALRSLRNGKEKR